jgi:uncharacterized repeat protein (TIGR01451 family)
MTFSATSSILRATYIVAALFFAVTSSSAQQWLAQAQSNGFTLKKVASDTVIATGQTFSYTVYFSCPAGAANVVVSDQLPATLEFLSASFTSPCGAPTVSAPAVNSMGGTYSLSWPSMPSGCSGSFTITVRFPNGVTCPGTAARNRVCLQAQTATGAAVDFCTPFTSTTATATEPWNIGKWVTGAAYQGGTCPYATGDSVITYQICVYKNVGTTGQMNLVNGVVTDVLPTGAVLQSSSCGATQTGNTITWNVGSMSALPMYNSACCTFTVLYPRATFPTGSQITNQAVLTGGTGSGQPSCGPVNDTSAKTCVEIKDIVKGQISKYAYTNGQPGCPGKYLIYICNSGTSTLTSLTVTDTVPTALTGLGIGTVSAGLNVSNVGNIFTATLTSPLAAGQCRWFEITFTIPATATVGSTITNCAWMSIPGNAPISGCNTFTVQAPAPQACTWKEVCAKQPSYTIGSTFRYRLRVQNIGGQPITAGALITDVLHSNLTYVGNVSTYTGTAWNAPCQSTSNWSGVTVNYNAGTNTVTATLPAIPASCQNIFYSACGMYGTGTVPYYFIEFDVKVVDTAALGNVPNSYTLSGGGLSSPVTSNIDYVTVVGTAGFTLQKGVRKSGSGSFATSATAAASGSVDFRLRMNVSPGSVALRHITFADLLPRDNGIPDDLILGPCTPRGSQFDLNWTSALTSSPTATPWNNTLAFSRVNNFAPTGAPGAMFVGGCGTQGTWTSGIPANAKNLGYYFGASPVAAGFNASVDFAAAIPASVQDQMVTCNSFAANAAVRHLIASSIISDQKIGELESALACVTIKTEHCIDSVKIDVKCAGKDAAGNQQYTVTITAWNPNSAGVLMFSSTDGTFSPSSFAIPTGAFTATTTFTDTPPVTGMFTLHFTLVINGQVICRDSILRDLPPCPDPKDECCREFNHKLDNVKFTYTNAGAVTMNSVISAGPGTMQKFVATIVSVQRRQVCNNVAQPWQRAFGDITGGSITSPLAPGPLLLSIFSREAQWGTGPCEPFQGVGLTLNMIFPPVPSSFKCRDTLVIAIRYTFTDCKCQVCDFIRYDTIVRRPIFIPWDPVDLGVNWTKRRVQKDGDVTQADTAAATSIVMDDATTGTLWIVNPDDSENMTTVHGCEITSPLPITSVKVDGTDGVINGDVAFAGVDCPPASTVGVDLTFENTVPLMEFPVTVRYLYSVAGGDQTFSEPVTYVARVPGGDPDEMGPDATTKPDNVRTYAVTFTAANSYKTFVGSVRLRSEGPARFLAVGPAGTDDSDILVSPISADGSNFTISAQEPGASPGVSDGIKIRPIFITLSNVENNTADISFTSYDLQGAVISSGSFRVSSPLSSVSRDGSGGNGGVSTGERPVATLNVAPNPASASITVTATMLEGVADASITVRDLQGRTVLTMLDHPLSYGTHVVMADVHMLPAGTYTVVLTTPQGAVSAPWVVVR